MAKMDKSPGDVKFFQQDQLDQYGMDAAIHKDKEYSAIHDLKQEQMLKLITKSFYKELAGYGIENKDVIAVANHLLDHLLQNNVNNGTEYYNRLFTLNTVKNEWSNHSRLTIEDVSIAPLRPEMYGKVELWLRNPAIKYSFISLFPEEGSALKEYFDHPARNYFIIVYQNEPVGVIGADHIDHESHKLEMRKFIGSTNLQGKGIGKHATFLFLYYSFDILKVNKVYIYSANTNMRNINLNSKFGFELEGIFFEESFMENKKRDIVRMGLLRSRWMEIFSNIS